MLSVSEKLLQKRTSGEEKMTIFIYREAFTRKLAEVFYSGSKGQSGSACPVSPDPGVEIGVSCAPIPYLNRSHPFCKLLLHNA